MEASRIAGQESFYSPLFALALQLLQGTPSVEGKVDWNHLCSSDVANRTIQPHGVELASPEVRAVRPSKIASIGLGAMGFGMANGELKLAPSLRTVLRAAGHNVVGYDAWKPSMGRYSAGDGMCSSTPEECGLDAKVLVLMVVDAAQAQQALFEQCVAQGEGGLAPSADRLALPFGASVILMSTVAPSQANALSERLRTVRGDL
jgi:hypothetical protein